MADRCGCANFQTGGVICYVYSPGACPRVPIDMDNRCGLARLHRLAVAATYAAHAGGAAVRVVQPGAVLGVSGRMPVWTVVLLFEHGGWASWHLRRVDGPK